LGGDQTDDRTSPGNLSRHFDPPLGKGAGTFCLMHFTQSIIEKIIQILQNIGVSNSVKIVFKTQKMTKVASID